MINLRTYQEEAIQGVLDYWRDGGGNPLVDLATGTGKSVVIAELVRRLIDDFPGLRVLMIVHVRELVEQNYRALIRNYPGASIGLYSAGLGKRDSHHKITFASIQSVYRKAAALGPRDLVLIDEAHLVPTSGNGMYRTLIEGLREARPDLRIAGFTATPYRLDSGRLDAGTDRLFDQTVYSYGIGQGIEDGFLSPLISKASAKEIDVSNVAKRGGEFVAGSLENAADRITAEACDEIVRYGEDRKAWLMFCSGVAHAAHARDAMRQRGISAEMVSGDTPKYQRDRIIRDFREGRIQCLTNANVLTTGFDVPQLDLVAMLRPTLSTSLYVQIVGRGTRIAPGKENCLILDFSGNVRRHGPVDAVSITGTKGGKDEDGKVAVDSVRAKECPECKELAALNASSCNTCGYEWPREEKPRHEGQADAETGILSTEKVPPKMLPVVQWQFDRWEKMGSPDSVRVTYFAGVATYREWLPFEHAGFARQKAMQWWSNHGGATPFPATVDEALERQSELTMPSTISVKPQGKFFEITGRTFAKEAAE